MPTPYSDRATADVLKYGKALLKYISPNDVGSTGSHQAGYYLPKGAWELFSPHEPAEGENKEHFVGIEWPDGRKTESCIKWYGVRTRSEYRLTRLGRDFPWLTDDNIGDLLILIPTDSASFTAHVLDLDDDIESLLAALGIEIVGSWAAYQTGKELPTETEDECINRRFRTFSQSLSDFPATVDISLAARRALLDCIADFVSEPADDKVLALMDAEYRLFRMVERKICEPQISRLFKSVDDFLSTASSIMNRRKSRAGRSLENHVQYLLEEARIPHDIRPDVDGKPDILIPGKAAYEDRNWPDGKLIMVGVKTTCKDRWRQILNEAHRIPVKHLLTIQQGISRNQLDEMHNAHVSLIVPKALHKQYPKGSALTLLSVEQFVSHVRSVIGV
jgi:hypothetical protein